MEHDGCIGCKYENEDANSKHCLGCKQNAIDKYAPMTNADAIRNMSDEELAEFLSDECGFSNRRWIEWLKSEVKEGEYMSDLVQALKNN